MSTFLFNHNWHLLKKNHVKAVRSGAKWKTTPPAVYSPAEMMPFRIRQERKQGRDIGAVLAINKK